ncbi:MAG: DUF2213 domain-containing protein [Myxococcales bacterium FL481]|nr:MAG: DUF2213 domain-containing protein [Myxococcales bacterium FL481]
MTETVQIYDFSSLAAPVTKIDDNGFLTSRVRISRTGVLRYRQPDGSVLRVLRHPDHVFADGAVESAKRLPVTMGHPKDFVTPETARQLTVGFLGESVDRVKNGPEESPELSVTLIDAEAIAAVQSGQNQVSIGARAEILDKSGTWNGQAYDAVHVNLSHNHLAIVPAGRAGPGVAIQDGEDFDGACAPEPKDPDMAQTTEEVQDSAPDPRDGELAELRSQVVSLTDKLDAATAKADALEAKLAEPPAPKPNILADAVRAFDAASLILGDAFTAEADGGSIRDRILAVDESDLVSELRKAVVLAKCGENAVADQSEAYIAARFDIELENASTPTTTEAAPEPTEAVDGSDILEPAAPAARSTATGGYVDPLKRFAR